jgi:ABC-type transporter Mla MlaB component
VKVTVKIHDRADEFRIELIGRFSGSIIDEVASSWKEVLADTSPRKCTVDISRLSGYDHAGRKLLREMYKHGTQFAAGNPVALTFLNEISLPERRGPAVVQSLPETNRQEDMRPLAVWRARAAGAK